MINIWDRATFYLAFRRRGRRWRTHGGSVHRAGHHLFYERRRLFRCGNLRQDAHRPDHLTQGEEEHQPNVPCIPS